MTHTALARPAPVRSLVFNAAYLLITVFFSLALVPCLVLPQRVFWPLVTQYFRTVAWAQEHVMGWRIAVEGREHIPAQGGFLVACKHQSTFETLYLCALLKHPAIILKKELFAIPVWGWHARKMGLIAIDRSAPKKAIKTLLDGVRAVADAGRPIIIFPQGTRVRPNQTAADAPYKSGIIRAYEHTGLPVVPVALNTGLFWPKGGFWKKRGTVTFRFLPAIPPGRDPQAVMRELETAIEQHSRELCGLS